MLSNRIIKSKMNTAILVITVISILSVFMPWFHVQGSLDYSGGGFSGGASARTGSVSGISTSTGFFGLVVCAAYAYFLWKKKTGPRAIFILIPWIIFFTVIGFMTSLDDVGASSSVDYGDYGSGSAKSKGKPDGGFMLYMLCSLTLLVVSPFRTRKALPGEITSTPTVMSGPSESAHTQNITPVQQHSDPLELIAKMKKMRDDGLLTDEEFERKKAELLNKI